MHDEYFKNKMKKKSIELNRIDELRCDFNSLIDKIRDTLEPYINKTIELNNKVEELLGGDKNMDEDSAIKILEALDLVTQNINKLASGNADLNGDGNISTTEKAIYDFYKTSLENTQKNSLWSNIVMAFFSLASLLSVVLSFLKLMEIF